MYTTHTCFRRANCAGCASARSQPQTSLPIQRATDCAPIAGSVTALPAASIQRSTPVTTTGPQQVDQGSSNGHVTTVVVCSGSSGQPATNVPRAVSIAQTPAASLLGASRSFASRVKSRSTHGSATRASASIVVNTALASVEIGAVALPASTAASSQSLLFSRKPSIADSARVHAREWRDAGNFAIPKRTARKNGRTCGLASFFATTPRVRSAAGRNASWCITWFRGGKVATIRKRISLRYAGTATPPFIANAATFHGFSDDQPSRDLIKAHPWA